MKTVEILQNEFQHEYQITKEFIAKFPNDKTDYKPHEKSMDIKTLSNHIVEVFAWPELVLKTDKLDFEAGDYKPSHYETATDLLKELDKDYAIGKSALENASEDDLSKRWKMCAGETTLVDFSKYEAIRHALNQITHHRAQLGVYYRLNDIELPSSYGPSADSQTF